MSRKPQHKQKSLIHLWIGRCISEWAAIEEVIFDVFCIALNTDTRLAAIVFYKTPNMQSRVTLTTELIEAITPVQPGRHHHPLRKQWDSITKLISGLIPIRNLMAHHPIDSVAAPSSTGSPSVSNFDGSLYKIETSKSEKLRGKSGSIKSIRESEMPLYYDKVRNVHTELINFRTEMQKTMLSLG